MSLNTTFGKHQEDSLSITLKPDCESDSTRLKEYAKMGFGRLLTDDIGDVKSLTITIKAEKSEHLPPTSLLDC